MKVSGYVRGIPTYEDLNGNTYGMLCETKEKCISDDSGVALDFKLEELRKQIESSGRNASTLEGHNAAHFATAESVTNITNGTTKVGNADKLDGHEAEYFASSESLNENILEKALTLNVGVHNYHLGNNYPTNTLPSVNYMWGSATVFVRNKGSAFVILWGIKTKSINCPPTFNYYNGAEWSGWNDLATTADLAKYLPLTGGTLTDNTFVKRTDNNSVMLGVENALNKFHSGVNGSGVAYMQDKNGNVIVCNTDGARTFNGTASGNVASVNGTAYLASHGGFTIQRTGGAVCAPKYVGNGNTLGYLGFSEADKPIFIDTNGSYRDILHTGNSAKVVISQTAPSDTNALWVW